LVRGSGAGYICRDFWGGLGYEKEKEETDYHRNRRTTVQDHALPNKSKGVFSICRGRKGGEHGPSKEIGGRAEKRLRTGVLKMKPPHRS